MTSIIFTGDLVLDEPDPDHWLSGIAPALLKADLAIGHLEVPHTLSRMERGTDVPAPAADPDNLKALPLAGFNAVTLAGNHMADCGEVGMLDTMTGLNQQGIRHCGLGRNLEQARQALWLDAGQRKIAVFSYNCVGPEFSWATATAAGCAWLPVSTADGSAVAPAKRILGARPEAREILQSDIAAVRRQAGLVIVALHKGTVHTPVVIENYERELAHMAIDAGADAVISHHAHIVRGVEFYAGKPIFHGLGNGCVVTSALSPGQSHPKRAEWVRRRKALFGFEPDPAYTLAPFHPEAVNAFMARFQWLSDGSLQTGIVPVFVDPPGRPRLATQAESVRISNYLQHITLAAGLPALNLEPGAEMINISAASG